MTSFVQFGFFEQKLDFSWTQCSGRLFLVCSSVSRVSYPPCPVLMNFVSANYLVLKDHVSPSSPVHSMGLFSKLTQVNLCMSQQGWNPLWILYMFSFILANMPIVANSMHLYIIWILILEKVCNCMKIQIRLEKGNDPNVKVAWTY